MAAHAGAAGAEKIPGDADDVGASKGVDRGSGVVVVPECWQSWTDVGGSDRNKICIVGGDPGCAEQEEPADRGTKTMGAEKTNTEVLVSEVARHWECR